MSLVEHCDCGCLLLKRGANPPDYRAGVINVCLCLCLCVYVSYIKLLPISRNELFGNLNFFLEEMQAVLGTEHELTIRYKCFLHRMPQ